jgi:hypothetical protein
VKLTRDSGCVASIVRFGYTKNLFALNVYYHQGFYRMSGDITSQICLANNSLGSVGSLFIVGIVEIGTGIIASSLTTIRPLLRSCASYRSTVRSYLHHKSPKSSQKSDVDLENNCATEEINELQEVTYHDHHLEHGTTTTGRKSDTSEEGLWEPYKENSTSHVESMVTEETTPATSRPPT